jgi:hypothetical protein
MKWQHIRTSFAPCKASGLDIICCSVAASEIKGALFVICQHDVGPHVATSWGFWRKVQLLLATVAPCTLTALWSVRVRSHFGQRAHGERARRRPSKWPLSVQTVSSSTQCSNIWIWLGSVSQLFKHLLCFKRAVSAQTKLGLSKKPLPFF